MAESTFKVDGGIEAVGVVTGTSFKKVGGSSTEFLMADGSIDSKTYTTTDTTYDIEARDSGIANKKHIRLSTVGGGNTDVTLVGGSNVTINRSDNELEIASSFTNTDTTYGVSAVSDGSNESIILTAGGSGSGISSVSFVPGSNVTLSRSNNDITINSSHATYSVQDGQLSENNFTNALKTKLDSFNATNPSYNSLNVTGITTFNGDVYFPGGTSGKDLQWDKSQNALEFGDDAKAKFGVNNDLKISHTDDLSGQNDSNGDSVLAGDNWCSLIEDSGTGPLIFKSDGGPSTGAFQFYDTSWRPILKLFSGSSARASLYYAGSEKLITSSTGVNITGEAFAGSGKFDNLTDTRIVFSGTGGALTDNSNLTFDGTTLAITGNETISNDLTIGGNLTVNGSQTIINSNTLQIGDSQILLNRDETGTPSSNAGVVVERGTSSNVQIRWNEGNDKWEFTNDGSAFQNIPTTNTTYGVSAQDGDVAGEKKVRLSGSNPSSTDEVVLAAGTNMSVARSGDKITFNSSYTDTDTTYSQSCVDSSNDVILRLTAGGTGSGNDDIKIKAGSNVTLTHNNSGEFTISSTDTNTTYSVGDGGLTQNNFTNTLKSKLDGIASSAEVNVQSDWNAGSGDAQILNKPTIPTNNNQLTNGAGFITAAMAGAQHTRFTSNGTWNKPASGTFVMILATGGGGGGSKNYVGGDETGGGGGGGACAFFVAPLSSLSSSYSVTVGGGGNGGSGSYYASGGAGGNSSVGSLCTAYGGAQGTCTSSSNATAGHGGGFGGTGAINLGGNAGTRAGNWGDDGITSYSYYSAGSATFGGGGGGFANNSNSRDGGNSLFGGGGGGGRHGSGGNSVNGGNGGNGGNTGSNGTVPGGGGGGAQGGNGGNGAAGQVDIYVI